MFFRTICILAIVCIHESQLRHSSKSINIVPVKFLQARHNPLNNNWISYNRNIFNQYHVSEPYKTFANILMIMRNRNCRQPYQLICVTCQEFNDFINMCPKTKLNNHINLYILNGNDSCSLKAKVISTPIPNFNCTIFKQNGFAYTFS